MSNAAQCFVGFAPSALLEDSSGTSPHLAVGEGAGGGVGARVRGLSS
jgi:hypothetical protein